MPALLALGLEGGSAWLARSAPRVVARTALNLTKREPVLRVGDNWATRAGQRAHTALRDRIAQKPGWDYEVSLPRAGARPLKPDVSAPARKPPSESRFQMELKPNTPSGRRAAARTVRKYEALKPKNKTRAIYYDPEDYM